MDDLTNTWNLINEIGEGGQSEVWRVENEHGEFAALKRILDIPGAMRELQIHEAISGLPNIMPITQVGRHGEYLAVLMPIAKYSLAAIIEKSASGLEPDFAESMFRDVLNGLLQIQDTVVHRDIKPSNILFYEDTWCLADFGIARMADVATSNPTRKAQLSEAYASPEQLQGRHATHKTDMHALAIVAIEAFTGKKPFDSLDQTELYQQITTGEPKYLNEVPEKYSILLCECLFKAPEARPNAEALINRLDRPLPSKELKGKTALAKAYEKRVKLNQEYERQSEIERLEKDRRQELVGSGITLYKEMQTVLLESIRSVVPSIYVKDSSNQLSIRFGGELLFDSCRVYEYNDMNVDGLPFDVILYGYIGIMLSTTGGRIGRAHSLWYCDAVKAGEYHWYDISFWKRNSSEKVMPYSLDPYDRDAQIALSGISHNVSVNRKFVELHPERLDDFVDEWSDWLAQSEEGIFIPPSIFPEHPDAEYSWRTKF